MRVTAMISFLIFFIISETAAIDFTSCYEKMQMTVPKSDPKQFYGSLNPFYSINKGIADGLQKQMDDSTLQDVYNLIAGTKGDKPSVGKVVNDVMKQQAGAIAFFCGGLLFILVAVVLGITICSCRCCCNSCGADKTKSHPSSSITAFFMVSGLVAVFAFVLTGVVIFNLSATNLYKAIDKSPGWINDTVNSINTNVFDGTSEMDCVVGSGVNQTLNVLTVQMLAFPQSLSNTLMDATGLTNLSNFNYIQLETDTIVAANLSDTLDAELSGACPKLATLLNKTYGLGPQLRNLSQIVVLVDKIQEAASSSISSATNNTQITDYLNNSILLIRLLEDQLTAQLNSLTSQVNISMQTVRNIQNAITTAQNDVVTWSGYSAVKGGWQALMTVPNCICLLFCLLTIFALLHWLYAEEGGHAAGYVAIFGFYFTIFLTVIAMGVTSAAFVGGWAISGACKPMFEDSTFKILGLASNIGNINITGLNNTSTSTSVQQLMQRCEGSATVFSAVNGSQLINPSMVLNMLQLDTLETDIDSILQQNPINYTTGSTYLPQLVDMTSFIKDAIITLSAADNDCFTDEGKDNSNLIKELMGINNELATLIELFNVTVVHSTDNTTTTVSVQFTNSQILIATNLVNSSTTDMINNLNSQAFPCHGLYQNYENAGVILCDWFGRPVHGMWGAAGLAAIFFIPAALIMLCAANKIFSGYCSRTNKIGDETGAPAGLHRTKTTENPWEDSDPFPRPAVYNTQPQQYSYVPPPVQEADYGTGLRRQNEAGLRRQDDGLQRTDPDSYGLRKTAERPAWEDSDDEQPAPYDIYNLDKDRTGKGLTRM